MKLPQLIELEIEHEQLTPPGIGLLGVCGDHPEGGVGGVGGGGGGHGSQ